MHVKIDKDIDIDMHINTHTEREGGRERERESRKEEPSRISVSSLRHSMRKVCVVWQSFNPVARNGTIIAMSSVTSRFPYKE